MRALSIRQPWAWLIVNGRVEHPDGRITGYKDIENRTWPLPAAMKGQRVYIHAGKNPDTHMGWQSAYSMVYEALEGDSGVLEGMSNIAAYGAIVGEVTIVDCVTESDSPWFVGPQGFRLANPVAYETQIPYSGRLGFFDVKS